MGDLTLGCVFSDRIEALLDGRVTLEGMALTVHCRPAQSLFKDVLTARTYDMAEMSLGSYVAAIASGDDHYVALPVFLSRAFRHSNIYVRSDRIRHPSDLAGMRVGVIDYQQTAGLWVRGLLADHYGVERESVAWVAGGLHAPIGEGRAPAPPGLDIRRTASTLDALLTRGEIDAIISPIEPASFAIDGSGVGRLFADPKAAELAYYDQTGIFPLMHTLVVRRSLTRDDPFLARRLYVAFDRARQIAVDELKGRDYAKVISPWLSQHRADVTVALDGDPWTYGVEANPAALGALMRYACSDGLTGEILSVEAAFEPCE